MLLGKCSGAVVLSDVSTGELLGGFTLWGWGWSHGEARAGSVLREETRRVGAETKNCVKVERVSGII